MRIDFEGKVAVVTGATRGIGKSIADHLESLGAELLLTGTSREEVDDLNASTAGNKRYLQADFSDDAGIDSFVAELGKMDRIDVCVNNAGINRINSVWETKTADWDDLVSVNLKAPFMVTRAVSFIMKRNGYGRIVNISSIFGTVSKEKRSIYSATKSGLIGFTRGASNDLARYGVLVNSLSPGVVLTDMTRQILGDEGIKEMEERIPAGRLAGPEEISRVALFLASDLNTYLTGKNIIVDGGYVDV
ncbi:MAG: SDR family oxidoreductase [Candidatus Omnitrophica bacterium]|nr:SDR family oxidoreductase [Candidatus Omnitrophota bacterium]